MGRGVVLSRSLAKRDYPQSGLTEDLLGSEDDELGGTTVQGLGGPGEKWRLATTSLYRVTWPMEHDSLSI